jgi:large subunit ribosomal protein L15
MLSKHLRKKTGVTVVTLEIIRENGLCAKKDLVKILSRGEISAAIEVQAHGFSASAVEAIEKAGGKAVKL